MDQPTDHHGKPGRGLVVLQLGSLDTARQCRWPCEGLLLHALAVRSGEATGDGGQVAIEGRGQGGDGDGVAVWCMVYGVGEPEDDVL